MTILNFKESRGKKYFLFLVLVLLFSLFLAGYFCKRSGFLKNKRSADDSISYPMFLPENLSKDPIDAFKSSLYPFKNIRNPCWYKTPFIPHRMLKTLQIAWSEQVFSKTFQTVHLSKVMVDIRTEWYLKSLPKFRCFPYFYIMSSSNCVRNEMWNVLVQHSKIAAPDKIDIDFWPNLLLDNIESYASQFVKAAEMIAQDKFMRTSYQPSGSFNAETFLESCDFVDASSSTFFQTNRFFRSNGSHYSNADFIKAFNQKVKILILLQNPITKIYADYLTQDNEPTPEQFHKKVIQSIKSFEMCLQVSELVECIYNKSFTRTYPVSLHLGIYWVFLERWRHNFQNWDLKLFCIEDYIKCRECVMKQIYDFIALHSYTVTADTKFNISYNCLNPELPMLKKTEMVLKEFYSPYNKKLAKISKNNRYTWH